MPRRSPHLTDLSKNKPSSGKITKTTTKRNKTTKKGLLEVTYLTRDDLVYYARHKEELQKKISQVEAMEMIDFAAQMLYRTSLLKKHLTGDKLDEIIFFVSTSPKLRERVDGIKELISGADDKTCFAIHKKMLKMGYCSK